MSAETYIIIPNSGFYKLYTKAPKVKENYSMSNSIYGHYAIHLTVFVF
jgi:hypothetical protein